MKVRIGIPYFTSSCKLQCVWNIVTVGERESALDRKGEIERSKYLSVSIYITPSKTLPIVACSMCSYSSTTQRERERERERKSWRE